MSYQVLARKWRPKNFSELVGQQHVLQALINMCVCLGLLPTKGLTLPLLSYGGTSLLLNMGSIGILMNISMRRFMFSEGAGLPTK